MKLFIYRDNVNAEYKSIHVYRGEDNAGVFICGKIYQDNIDKLITGSLYSRPFCVICTRMLKEENVSIKQLAIYQKLGIKC